MRKKELAKIIIERLKEEYPDADCTLDYNDAWKLLISVRLAAQCTDARVNVVVPHLYEKFPTIDALANADVSEIEEIVRPCGLGRSKARDISLCMRMLRDEFDSKVPDDFNQLLKLPGVGRKSTLRGERDTIFATASIIFFTFQLTRSVGSVTKKRITELGQAIISTHTLRGERDTYTI